MSGATPSDGAADDDRSVGDPLRAAHRAPAARTLLDVFEATVAAWPQAVAIDDGDELLTYEALAEAVRGRAERLAAAGVRRGDRVGVRAASGTVSLYVSILAVLRAGAAYVPVDADDPEERAATIFAAAGVDVVMGDVELLRPDGTPIATPITTPIATPAGNASPGAPGAAGTLEPERPTLDDGAWVIFTSGSTGTPKGVAVTHRSAAAFVDAEARIFLAGAPLGPGDRVLAGLSVAFDASCEEMWLAWRHGATLVPAPRALVRAGMELGPWLVEREITVVSTVPTLAGLWPPETLDGVRMLIFGGEAVPPEFADRLWRPDRELWNTYGPTEGTVVACAALLTPGEPVRIGLPLDGWDLAVVGADGEEVAAGETGELVIGGVGVARYLDPELDGARFAPVPLLGPERAYRTGDLVVRDPAGLLFVGRADDQVKVNGHRIELAEVDAALRTLPGVAAAAAAVRRSAAGASLLVGYVVADQQGADLDTPDLLARLRELLPGSMVPLLAPVGEIPTRTSGKVDRDALPWPVEGLDRPAGASTLRGTEAWVGEQWAAVVGVHPAASDDDFFARGGSSLTAAQLVSALRTRYPEVTVAAVYANPTVGELAAHLDGLRRTAPDDAPPVVAPVRPVPVGAQALQLLVLVVVRSVVGLRWLTVLAALNALLDAAWSVPWAVPVSWWWVAAGWLLTISPVGRMGLSALAARALLAGVRPGTYPRAGSVHLRLWAAERFADGVGAVTPATAPYVGLYARALGVRIGRDVDLHSVPPLTGMLTLGRESSVEPEVDLSGYWVDGDALHLGRVVVGPRATVGARSVLYPGAVVGSGTDVAAGSAVHGTTGSDEYWIGSPARRAHEARHPWPAERPDSPGRMRWVVAYAGVGLALAVLPLVAAAVGLLLVGFAVRDAPDLGAAVGPALLAGTGAALVAYAVYALLVVVGVRLGSRGLTEGYHPARSRVAVQAWGVERLMDAARTILFPLYSSVATPAWLRLLGAQVGQGTEISTVVGLPSMMRLRDGAFLADDTMVAPYEVGGGWVRIASAKVGRRAFVGNSGMTAPGRTVAKNGLVAVLSATPNRTRPGLSYLGSPPVKLPRAATLDDPSRTYEPPTRLKVLRGLVELCRLVPAVVTCLVALGVVLGLQAVALAAGWGVAAATAGLVLCAAGAVAGLVTIAAKWVLVGRFRPTEHPLWSSAVWRGELADTFTESVAAPYLADPATGSVALVWWLRGMGARVGRGVWCETYWLPEADLVHLGDGATVGPGCVVQTHLFHDRVMSLDTVVLEDGATLGPHGIVLPAARIGAGATVGPASLVLRGEAVPAGTRWVGNPIAPWHAADDARRRVGAGGGAA
ncbi:Pls/PosA family non-ribosomal peptide synthetase [Cellulomonas fimi]|uniref:Amino acid adenylation domain-containing protein n=1 Tax=Cellulomonas fimi TaxID=1708 RepID=A0A7Y0QJ41_CELFI|nr:Pls/PosA family non-ribosomal peptide synthetase [Cellulomonas fimi]NMR20942.1 amino acid adenylation domain-containing protein [Cellulomonas fimi]